MMYYKLSTTLEMMFILVAASDHNAVEFLITLRAFGAHISSRDTSEHW